MKLIKVKDYNNFIHYINPVMIVDIIFKGTTCKSLTILTVKDQAISVVGSDIDKILKEIVNA